MDSRHIQWATIKKDEYCESIASSSSSLTSSSLSSSSSSLSDSSDDASSSPSGPLYQLASLIDHLPIKRGLSKFYDGKSQTFASLASVMSVEDLAKNHRTRRIKASSFSRNLNHHKFGPKPTIRKGSPKRSLSPSFAAAKVTMLILT